MISDKETGVSQNESKRSNDHYLFVDLETGGLYPTKHSILQIAAVITDLDFKTQGYFMSYVKPHPHLEVSEYALSVNQLNWADLQNAPEEDYVAIALQQFALLKGQKGRFSGYNCQFDLEFLSLMWLRQNNIDIPYQVPWLDIYTCAKSKLGNKSGLPNFKLASVAKYFGIDSAGAHDALQDLFMTIEIAKQLKSMPDREDQDSVGNLETSRFTLTPEKLVSYTNEPPTIAVKTYTEEIVN